MQLKESDTGCMYKEVITFVEFCVIFKVNCKGKFLITYIFHDVFFLKSLYEVSQLSFSINSVGLKVVCSSIVCFGGLWCLFFSSEFNSHCFQLEHHNFFNSIFFSEIR